MSYTKIVCCALLLIAPSLSFAQFAPNDYVELLRDEPLLFSNTVHRQGKRGERFSVAAYRQDTHKVFLIAKDDKGKTIAINVSDTAVMLVKKDVIALNEQAFAALREGRLDEAQKLMIQVAVLDTERSVCWEIATQLGRITTAQLAYQQEFKKMPQIQAEIKQWLRNAEVLDRAALLDANDKSNQVRAEQGRKDAELLGASAKALLKSNQEQLVSELQQLGKLAKGRVTDGAYGEALNMRASIRTLISRIPDRDGISDTEVADSSIRPRIDPSAGGIPGLPSEPATTFESNLAISELEKWVLESNMHLNEARRSLAAKRLHSALRSASAGLAVEHGSYSLRHLHDEISVRIEAFNKVYAVAFGDIFPIALEIYETYAMDSAAKRIPPLAPASSQIIAPVPTNPVSIVLDRNWDTVMKGGDATMKDLALLLSPYAKPTRDTSPAPTLIIYPGVTYLMPFQTARKALGLKEALVSKNKVACPGFPKDSFFHYSFNGVFEDNFRLLYIVVDRVDQVVSIQFVSESPIKDRIDTEYGNATNKNWHTYNFVNARSKARKSLNIWHSISYRYDESIRNYNSDIVRARLSLRVDSVLRDAGGKELEAVRWYLPVPLAGLILQCVKDVAP